MSLFCGDLRGVQPENSLDSVRMLRLVVTSRFNVFDSFVFILKRKIPNQNVMHSVAFLPWFEEN